MPDEPVVEEQVVEPAVEPAAAVEPEPEPHPLAEGGARFNEVYARMKAAEAAAAQANERIARLEGAAQARQQPVQQYTSEQVADYLQNQVDRGAMTPMQAANALSQFNAQRTAQSVVAQTVQMQTVGSKMQAALNEVNQYVAKIPALKDTSSKAFQAVSEAANRISDDLGFPVTDVRVQRQALREAFGSLERLAAAEQTRQQSRGDSLPHVEVTPGGVRNPVKPNAAADALKDVPPEYIAFWKKRGYTEEQMKAEAAYVKRPPRRVQGQNFVR